MSNKDEGSLLAIVDACKKIQKFVGHIGDADTFYADEKTFDAVLMNFVVIGESVIRLSGELMKNNKQIAWTKIKGFRNIIAHDYFGVDAEEVWQMIRNNIPKLEEGINDILEQQ